MPSLNWLSRIFSMISNGNLLVLVAAEVFPALIDLWKAPQISCAKCRAVLRDSSCQSSEVGLGDFQALLARMKKSPCRSAGIYSRK